MARSQACCPADLPSQRTKRCAERRRNRDRCRAERGGYDRCDGRACDRRLPPAPQPRQRKPRAATATAAADGDSDRKRAGQRAAQPAGRVRPDRIAIDQDTRPADAEHGQSRVPAVVGRRPDRQYPNEPAGGDGWEVSDPYSMEGYEGATAYAIANAMGFTPDMVDWVAEHRLRAGLRAGPEAVRLPHGPDLDPAQARAER